MLPLWRGEADVRVLSTVGQAARVLLPVQGVPAPEQVCRLRYPRHGKGDVLPFVPFQGRAERHLWHSPPGARQSRCLESTDGGARKAPRRGAPVVEGRQGERQEGTRTGERHVSEARVLRAVRGAKEARLASHRREPAEQRTDEPHRVVSAVSPDHRRSARFPQVGDATNGATRAVPVADCRLAAYFLGDGRGRFAKTASRTDRERQGSLL